MENAKAMISEDRAKPINEKIEIKVIENTATLRYIVLPHISVTVDELSDDQIDRIRSSTQAKQICAS